MANSQKPTQVAPYTEAQVRRWLAFLARNMQQHGQTVVLIEQLQPTWLPTRWQHWCYVLSSRLLWMVLLFGLIVGLVVGPFGGLLFWLVFGLVDGPIGGLVGGLVVGLIDLIRAQRREAQAQAWSLRPIQILLRDMLVFGLFYGLVNGLFFGLIYGLVGGPIGGLIGGFLWHTRSTQRSQDGEIRIVETMKWSWRNTRRHGCQGGLVGLLVGLFVGPVIGLVDGTYGGQVGELVLGPFGGLVFGLIVGLVVGPFGGLIVGLVGGLTAGIREMNTRPNQGIWLTVRYAFFIGSVVGLTVGLPVGWFGTAGNGVISGLIGGLLAGLWFGGFDVLQHGLVRLLLWWRGDAPLNYARFLDYAATDLHFLQKVGGGYIFVHRYLLEHFAAMVEEGEQST